MNTPSTIPTKNDVATPGPYRIVGATSFGVFLSALDASIVNVSLVTIKDSLGVAIDAIQWVVVAYLLIMTSLMPLMGKLGDRLGKTRIFQLGMLVFISGSFACAISTTLEILVLSRVFQAIGAAMISANGLALVTYFTTPQNRGRAIGLNSIILAVALGSGPVLGGILSQFYGWQMIFLVNLPIGIIGFLVVQFLVPQTDPVQETRFDTIGAALFFSFLFLLIYYVTVATISDVATTILLVSGICISFIGFLLRERSFSDPIISIEVLSDKKISTSIFSALLAYMAMIPVVFLLPFYLQEALGFNQSMTGMFLIVQPVMISITGPISGFVSERLRARVQTVAGLIVQLVGLLFIAFVIPNVILIAIGVAIMATGLSFFSVANGNFIMTSAPKKYMGVVSALTNLSRTTGFSIATALVTTVFGIYFAMFTTEGVAYIVAYSQAFQSSILIFCALALIAAIISSFRGMSPAEDERENSHVESIPTT